MSVVRVTRKGQTTIPKRIREKLGIKEGDSLIVELIEGKIVMVPVPRLENLAGFMSDYGDVEEVKSELRRMREEDEQGSRG